MEQITLLLVSMALTTRMSEIMDEKNQDSFTKEEILEFSAEACQKLIIDFNEKSLQKEEEDAIKNINLPKNL